MSAARWKTVSIPETNSRMRKGSATSPSLISSAGMSISVRNPLLPVELYASSTRTLAPAEIRASVRCEPMNPQPPVTRTRRPCQKSTMVRSGSLVALRRLDIVMEDSYQRPSAGEASIRGVVHCRDFGVWVGGGASLYEEPAQDREANDDCRNHGKRMKQHGVCECLR